MRRVVVTGMGIVSCLGNLAADVSRALREGCSGIRAMPDYAARGLRSQVAGVPQIDLEAAIDRKLKRFMGDAAAYAYVAMREAIADAGLAIEQVCHPRSGVIAGSGGGSAQWQIETGDVLREKGVRRIGPYMVPRTMCSTVSATLASAFGILGLSYSIAAACATSAHCIGAAADLIRHGAQDVMFAGGGEELHWGMTAQFDAMGALSSHYNDAPHTASRPYDTDLAFQPLGAVGLRGRCPHARSVGAVRGVDRVPGASADSIRLAQVRLGCGTRPSLRSPQRWQTFVGPTLARQRPSIRRERL